MDSQASAAAAAAAAGTAAAMYHPNFALQQSAVTPGALAYSPDAATAAAMAGLTRVGAMAANGRLDALSSTPAAAAALTQMSVSGADLKRDFVASGKFDSSHHILTLSEPCLTVHAALFL